MISNNSGVPVLNSGRRRLEAKDLARAGGACRTWRSMTSGEAHWKTLCKPYLGQEGLPEVDDISTCKCFFTGKPATAWVLWGRSY